MSSFFIELYSEEMHFELIKDAVPRIEKLFENAFANSDFCKAFITPCRIILQAEMHNNKDINEKGIISFLDDISSIFIQNANWNSNIDCWIAPLRNIVCLLDGELMNFEYCGVKSCNSTFGHKTLIGFDKKITVTGFDHYKIKMRENFVLIDQNERRELIVNEISRIEKELNLFVSKIQTVNYDDIIDEIVYSTEFPSVYVGRFRNEYLRLPQLIIKEIIFKGFKSICLKNESGILSNSFILFANTKTSNNGKYILDGVEKSVNNVFSFIDFELMKFLSESIDTKLEKLKTLTYNKGFGGILGHVNRLVNISKFLCLWFPHCDLIMTEDAARLCKVDYTTNLIKLYPELSGFFAALYAEFNKYPEYVYNGIEEHYKPRNAQDDIPSSDIGRVLAISDRIENITSLFIKNKESTSSSDIYGIRKSAAAIIRIIVDGDLNIPLKTLVHKSISLFGTNVYKDNKDDGVSVKAKISEIQNDIILLFDNKFYSFVESRGYNKNIILAVKNAKATYPTKSPSKLNSIYKKIVSISDYQKNNKEKFNTIKNTHKRLKNIVSDFGEKNLRNLFRNIFGKINLKLDDDRAFGSKIKSIRQKLKIARRSENYSEYLDTLFEFNDLLNDYFKHHLIKTDNIRETNMRLFLMLKIKKAFDVFLDFSVL